MCFKQYLKDPMSFQRASMKQRESFFAGLMRYILSKPNWKEISLDILSNNKSPHMERSYLYNMFSSELVYLYCKRHKDIPKEPRELLKEALDHISEKDVYEHCKKLPSREFLERIVYQSFNRCKLSTYMLRENYELLRRECWDSIFNGELCKILLGKGIDISSSGFRYEGTSNDIITYYGQNLTILDDKSTNTIRVYLYSNHYLVFFLENFVKKVGD